VRPASEDDRSHREARLLKEGRKRYIHVLHKQMEELVRLQQVEEEKITAELAATYYRVVHTLKGSAPMFGFVRIGAIAQSCLQLWQWAQDDESLDLPLEALKVQYVASVKESQSLIDQLTMEIDIYTRELELDEHQEHTQHSKLAPQGERLLVIDDDEVLRSYLTRRLRLDGYLVDEAADVREAQRLLREHTYHLITLDLMMYPQSGYELFEYLKDDPTLKWIPLIVLSGRNDVNDKVRCFHLGADDYVTKPFQYQELNARIYSLLKRTRTFEQMAFRDPLTGVYNRRFFDHQIQAELQRIARYPGPISMVFIDIDRFKRINDTHGHQIGDLVLQGLAHLLQNHIRSTDLLARFGGEEFVVVFPGTPASEAHRMMEAILHQTNQEPVVEHEGQAFYITFSAGVSEWKPGMSLEEWIERSDSAMYEAKQTGRNRVILKQDEGMPIRSTLAQTSQQRKKVLIADDDKILRSILMAKLKHLSVDFVEAVDGEEACRLLSEQEFQLCILDGVMPRLDGFGVLARLKAGELHSPQTKILMLSGRTREDDVSRGLLMGAHAYMHKPFSMVEMELKVKELLEMV
jgi:two-component system, cell cycle response regulator